MKKFVCETCGSSSLIKQDGLYICEYCRTKYSIEEAKKLFVEVTINHDEEVKELFNAAQRKLETKNWYEAHDIFKRILSFCPNDWQAVFYTEVTKTLMGGRSSLPQNASSLSKAIKETLHILQSETADKELDDNVATINELIVNLCSLYYTDTKKTEKHFTFDSVDAQKARTPIYTACIDLCYYYGDVLHSFFGDRYRDMVVNAWKQGVTFQSNSMIKECQLGTASDYEAKIQKYEPNWSFKNNGKKEVRKSDSITGVFSIIAIIAIIYSFFKLPVSSALVATVFIIIALLALLSHLPAIVNIVAVLAILVSLTKLPTGGGVIVAILIAVVWYFINKYLKKKESESAIDI